MGERGPAGDRGPIGETGPAGKLPVLAASALIVATLALVIVTYLQVLRIDGFADDLRDFAVETCERQNAIKEALSEFIVRDAKDSSKLPPAFFPSIPPEDFAALQKRGMREALQTAKDLAPAACESEVPQ